MNRSFTFTEEASAHALELWTYLADRAGEKVADRTLARIYDECKKSERIPGLATID